MNSDTLETLALSKSNANFAKPKGAHLFERLDSYASWIKARHQLGYWHYARQLGSSPNPVAKIGYMDGALETGVNLAVQDYLGLSTHPTIREAATAAVHDFGVHSAGSAMLLGNNPLSFALERSLSELVRMEHVLLFPTGWGAGFGVVKGLVREYDHIVMDTLAHACLQEGANAATKNITRYKHLDVDAAEEALGTIRAKDAHNSILVITEGIFSMDSDAPDLKRLQDVCRAYSAFLLVDVAHDLGARDPQGSGELGLQGVLGEVDLIIGAFSKTFASNGGFIATNDARVKAYLQWFANPHTFSNALSPIQCSVVARAVEIVRSPEGDTLRSRLIANAELFRSSLEDGGARVLGVPSAIVPVMIGREAVGRRASRIVNARGVFTNMIEFPAVGMGAARFRCQLMSSHEADQLTTAADAICTAIEEAAEARTQLVA